MQATISSNEDSNEDDRDEPEVVSALQTQRRSSKTPVNTNSRRSSASSDIVTPSGNFYQYVYNYFYSVSD